LKVKYKSQLWPLVIYATNEKFKTCFSEIEDTLVYLKEAFGATKTIVRNLGGGVVSTTSLNRKFKDLGIPVRSRGGANNIRTFPIDMKKFFTEARTKDLSSRQMSEALKTKGVSLSPEAVRFHIMKHYPELLMEQYGERHWSIWRAAIRRREKTKAIQTRLMPSAPEVITFPALALNTIQGVDLGRRSI